MFHFIVYFASIGETTVPDKARWPGCDVGLGRGTDLRVKSTAGVPPDGLPARVRWNASQESVGKFRMRLLGRILNQIKLLGFVLVAKSLSV